MILPDDIQLIRITDKAVKIYGLCWSIPNEIHIISCSLL